MRRMVRRRKILQKRKTKIQVRMKRLKIFRRLLKKLWSL